MEKCIANCSECRETQAESHQELYYAVLRLSLALPSWIYPQHNPELASVELVFIAGECKLAGKYCHVSVLSIGSKMVQKLMYESV